MRAFTYLIPKKKITAGLFGSLFLVLSVWNSHIKSDELFREFERKDMVYSFFAEAKTLYVKIAISDSRITQIKSWNKFELELKWKYIRTLLILFIYFFDTSFTDLICLIIVILPFFWGRKRCQTLTLTSWWTRWTLTTSSLYRLLEEGLMSFQGPQWLTDVRFISYYIYNTYKIHVASFDSWPFYFTPNFFIYFFKKRRNNLRRLFNISGHKDFGQNALLP